MRNILIFGFVCPLGGSTGRVVQVEQGLEALVPHPLVGAAASTGVVQSSHLGLELDASTSGFLTPFRSHFWTLRGLLGTLDTSGCSEDISHYVILETYLC